jgi:hypothetical protein
MALECRTAIRATLLLAASLAAPAAWADPFDDMLLRRQAMLTGGPGINQPLIYRGAFMDMVRGREVSRAGSGDHGAGHSTAAGILRLSLLAPAGAALKMQAMVKEWLTSDTSRDWSAGIAMDRIMPLSRLLADSAIPARGELLGSWIFAGMDRVVHLRPGLGLRHCHALQPHRQLREHQQRKPARLAGAQPPPRA